MTAPHVRGHTSLERAAPDYVRRPCPACRLVVGDPEALQDPVPPLLTGFAEACADLILEASMCLRGISTARGAIARSQGSTRSFARAFDASAHLMIDRRRECVRVSRLSAANGLAGCSASTTGARVSPRSTLWHTTPDGVCQVINDRVNIQIGGQSPSHLLCTIGIELVEKRGEA